MIKCKNVEFHGPFFMAGTNFKAKVQQIHYTTVEMWYDKEQKELFFTFKGETTVFPSTSILHYTPETQVVVPIKPEAPKVYHKKVNAQASTPTDHVFASGAGKTND